MAKNKKELKVTAVMVTYKDGQRTERLWDDIPEAEREFLSKALTDRFMKAAGYVRADSVKATAEN